jgi:replication-associated recombination protein RarA
MLIAGSTNNGKTMLVQRFVKAHPFVDDPKAEALEAQVLYLQMPPTPDARQFFLAVLDRLDAPVRRTASLAQLQALSLKILSQTRTKILIIDEIHNILGGRYEQQRAFLNLLRFLSNEIRVNLVCCGIATAARALQSDEQLANRFEHWPLPRWRIDNQTSALLNTVEMALPLKEESKISKPDVMDMIVSLSEGTIGEMIRLVALAAAEAINSGKEQIDRELLQYLRWIPPSERRKAAERALGLTG